VDQAVQTLKLKDKVAIVTGSSRGIGRSIALEMAKEGAKIVVAARTEVETRQLPGTIYQTVEQVKREGGQALAIKMNITDDQQVKEMVRRTMAEFGRIDILVNNAGIGSPDSVIEISIKRWDLIIAVNLRGTFLCTKAVLPHMLTQRSGHIINMSSVVATAVEGSVVYGVTKAAIARFTQGLAKELKPYNIAVNALCPSFTDTEGVRFGFPGLDRGKLQQPKMWGRYAVLVAYQKPTKLTGRVLTVEDLKQEFGDS